jgi:5-formyltetrahydrofolate cyclo-ligase
MSPEALRARKRAIRKQMVERILALDPIGRLRDEALLTERFASLPGFATAEIVLLYVTAFPEEIATRPLLDQALDQGKRVVCPRVDRRERRLRLFEIADPARELAPATLGIPEPRQDCPEVLPERIDWVLVPGLAFDPKGYRIGRGAGHYDRLLPSLRPDAQTWALIHDCQWVDEVPIEPHDVPVHGVASARASARLLRNSTDFQLRP